MRYGAAAALAALAWVAGGGGPAARAGEIVADPAPSVLPLMVRSVPGGEPVALDRAPVLLHLTFFATWCRACVDELPQLADWEARWRPEGYRLVLVAVPTRQSIERLSTFLEAERRPGLLVSDADGSAARALGVEAIPAHVLVDASGAVVFRARSVADLSADQMERLIAPRSSRRGWR